MTVGCIARYFSCFFWSKTNFACLVRTWRLLNLEEGRRGLLQFESRDSTCCIRCNVQSKNEVIKTIHDVITLEKKISGLKGASQGLSGLMSLTKVRLRGCWRWLACAANSAKNQSSPKLGSISLNGLTWPCAIWMGSFTPYTASSPGCVQQNKADGGITWASHVVS